MQNPAFRIIQRYLVPNLMVSLYHFWKHRAVVSAKSIVQFTPRVTLGPKTVVKPYAVISTNKGRVSIGMNCAISSFNHIAAHDSDVIIGDHVRTGPGVVIHGSRRQFKRRDALIVEQGHSDQGVVIGDDVLIGAHAAIFECRIGKGAVIGAGSVVSRDVPEYAIIVGVPGRVVGNRS